MKKTRYCLNDGIDILSATGNNHIYINDCDDVSSVIIEADCGHLGYDDLVSEEISHLEEEIRYCTTWEYMGENEVNELIDILSEEWHLPKSELSHYR